MFKSSLAFLCFVAWPIMGFSIYLVAKKPVHLYIITLAISALAALVGTVLFIIALISRNKGVKIPTERNRVPYFILCSLLSEFISLALILINPHFGNNTLIFLYIYACLPSIVGPILLHFLYFHKLGITPTIIAFYLLFTLNRLSLWALPIVFIPRLGLSNGWNVALSVLISAVLYLLLAFASSFVALELTRHTRKGKNGEGNQA